MASDTPSGGHVIVVERKQKSTHGIRRDGGKEDRSQAGFSHVLERGEAKMLGNDKAKARGSILDQWTSFLILFYFILFYFILFWSSSLASHAPACGVDRPSGHRRKRRSCPVQK
jgi:hypothetical protein